MCCYLQTHPGRKAIRPPYPDHTALAFISALDYGPFRNKLFLTCCASSNRLLAKDRHCPTRKLLDLLYIASFSVCFCFCGRFCFSFCFCFCVYVRFCICFFYKSQISFSDRSKTNQDALEFDSGRLAAQPAGQTAGQPARQPDRQLKLFRSLLLQIDEFFSYRQIIKDSSL